MDERNGNHIKIYALRTIDFIVFLSSKSPKKSFWIVFLNGVEKKVIQEKKMQHQKEVMKLKMKIIFN